MTSDQIRKIKEEYARINALLYEKETLRKMLKTKTDTYENIRKLSNRLEVVEDALFMIHNEDDIYEHLKDSSLFEEFQCDAEKKLYFFYGYVYESEIGENWNGKRLVFVPRNTKFSPSIRYYAMYFDLVAERDYELISLEDIKKFESNNYVIDIGEDINKPYENAFDYHILRQYSENDNIQESFEKYRKELFRFLVHSETEEEAIKKLVLNHQNKQTHSM